MTLKNEKKENSKRVKVAFIPNTKIFQIKDESLNYVKGSLWYI